MNTWKTFTYVVLITAIVPHLFLENLLQVLEKYRRSKRNRLPTARNFKSLKQERKASLASFKLLKKLMDNQQPTPESYDLIISELLYRFDS